MTATVIDYFSQQASGYHLRSLRWPWTLTRQRESRAIRRLLGDVTGRSVLDLGCGAGYYTRLVLSLGARHVYAVDLSPNMVAQLPTDRVTGIVSDAATVSLEVPVERVVAAGVLEFTPDPGTVLRSIRRLCTHDAIVALLIPGRTLGGELYARFHARHGIPINRTFATTLHETAAASGFRVERVESVWPMALTARLRVA